MFQIPLALKPTQLSDLHPTWQHDHEVQDKYVFELGYCKLLPQLRPIGQSQLQGLHGHQFVVYSGFFPNHEFGGHHLVWLLPDQPQTPTHRSQIEWHELRLQQYRALPRQQRQSPGLRIEFDHPL